jgi:hypothetical protein
MHLASAHNYLQKILLEPLLLEEATFNRHLLVALDLQSHSKKDVERPND